jgi:hypothetical protein
LHVPTVQVPEQGAVPAHTPTVQLTVAPAQQAKPSSQTVSQSSSDPLHVSTGGVHAPGAGVPHDAVQVPVPVVPHDAVQLVGSPAQQVEPSSHVPSQSSSCPLQISTGGTHAPATHAALHALVPIVPHDVVQLDT